VKVNKQLEYFDKLDTYKNAFRSCESEMGFKCYWRKMQIKPFCINPWI